MPPINRNCLSEHDNAVLDAIFNPMQLTNSDISNSLLYNDEELPDNLHDVFETKTTDVIESLKVEADAVKAAEEKEFHQALTLFQKSIDLAPHRAAPYNNRAQTHRLMGNDDAALKDLDEAIKLSNATGRTGCKALCQRGLLYRKQEKNDEAKADFNIAAKLGSKFARNQLVELNPYAALCNQMLRDVFQKLS